MMFDPALTPALWSRREALQRCGLGFGALALGQILSEAKASPTQIDPVHPLAPRAPQFPAKAKHVIHLFMNGGPSHVDTFDPKPKLTEFAGKELPIPNLPTERKTGAAFASPYKFSKYGNNGLEVSEIFAKTAECADDLCVIRSMHADVPNHEPSLLLMNCGEARSIRPSFGSWMTYGLGTENQNLPAFIAMCPGGYPIQESQNWQAGFLPGIFQGTYIDTQHTAIEKLIEHIQNRRTTTGQQRQQLDLLRQLNQKYQEDRQNDAQLEARIQSFELAFRMQQEAAEAFDISREPKHIQEMYGTGTQARQILIARRLVERGVRFVQVWHGEGQPWDNHDDIEVNHRRLAGQCDQAIGALIKDLKQRGLLDETLIIWGGEFGRTPMVQGGNDGRDHHNRCFSIWLAGGGIKAGYTHGVTDDFGFNVAADRVHVHDLHATLLHLLGFDHTRLTFRFQGRDYRLTDVAGTVVKQILS